MIMISAKKASGQVVVGAHAGPDGLERLRQIHEALKVSQDGHNPHFVRNEFFHQFGLGCPDEEIIEMLSDMLGAKDISHISEVLENTDGSSTIDIILQ